jgi:hypothetical protein
MMLYDDSVGAGTYRGQEDQTALSTGTWYFVVATSAASSEVSAGVKIYVNGVDTGDANVEGDIGNYDAMEDKGAVLALGSSEGTGGTNINLFDGAMAMPFVTGKVLTALEIRYLYEQGKLVLGL